MDRYRLVSRIIQEAAPDGGALVARFDKPFILLTCAYDNAGVIDYLNVDAIKKPAGDGTPDGLHLLRQHAKNPLFCDQLGDISKFALMASGFIDFPENTETEVLFITDAGYLVITYLEKTNH